MWSAPNAQFPLVPKLLLGYERNVQINRLTEGKRSSALCESGFNAGLGAMPIPELSGFYQAVCQFLGECARSLGLPFVSL